MDSSPTIWRQWSGPLSEHLRLRAGPFGLGHLPDRLQPETITTSVCGFCSTGCGLNIHLREGRAINLSASPDYPVNLGMACPKGWEALTPLGAPDRATTPLLREKNGPFEAVDWHRALSAMTSRFRDIQQRHGPQSLAWIGTGQITNEELALLGALGKFGMGMTHGDGNTRQCMATAVAAYRQSFGFDAPPYTYADFEQSDVVVLIGSNLCIAHPILWQRMLRNTRKPEIIVIDPRRTETAMGATQHCAIRPKSDLVLFYGLARRFLEVGQVDEEFVRRHTEGFEAFKEFIGAYTTEVVLARTGLKSEEFDRLAHSLGCGKRVSYWWTMGINQGHQATRTAQAIINLALMTGQIGRPGSGANSITGQCNAMGSRLFSNTTNLLGGREFTDPEDRRAVAQILNIPIERIPQQNSWAYDQIIEGIRSGDIRGLWVIATNTAHSWIHQKDAQELLGKLEFLVVQDMYHNTETALQADLVLPAAGWGEKEGTFINSERRFGLAKKVAQAPRLALSDFSIFQLVAEYWGCADLFRRWTTPEATFQILKELSAGQPCDITGIRDYQMLDQHGGLQWPLTPQAALANATDLRERRLFEDKRFFTPNGRARFLFEPPLPLPEPPDEQFPFLLMTGRGATAQWHTQTRTAKSAVLRQLYPENPYVEIHPQDANALRIRSGQTVRVRSRRGVMSARASLTAAIQRGQLFIPMHYPETNQLTYPVFDPHSRQPGYKACAVAVDPAPA